MSETMRNFVQGKIHGMRITQCKLHYNGSCEIDPVLLKAAGIRFYEQVHILNMDNGSRIITYVFPGAKPGSGHFSLNGGAARHGCEGDRCIIIAYKQEPRFTGAKCIIIDPATNGVHEVLDYQPDSEDVAEPTSPQ